VSAATAPRAPSAAGAVRRLLLVLAGALLVAAIYGALFTVDVTAYGVVSRFGHIVRVVDTPGLHLKLPFERVLPVDRRLLYAKPAQAEYLTSDKKNVVVRSLALWRIADPKRFLETVRNRAGAELQLAGARRGWRSARQLSVRLVRLRRRWREPFHGPGRRSA
jgi:regulator of protease activity HflC (stomatin/prohibitin superfamily)